MNLAARLAKLETAVNQPPTRIHAPAVKTDLAACIAKFEAIDREWRASATPAQIADRDATAAEWESVAAAMQPRKSR